MSTTCIHPGGTSGGDAAGMVSLGGCYIGLLAVKEGGRLTLQQRTDHLEQEDEVREPLCPAEWETLVIRMKVRESAYISFEAGPDMGQLVPVGRAVEAAPGRWVGVKAGLTAINEKGSKGGRIQIDHFVFQPLE